MAHEKSTAEERLIELHIELPVLRNPVANYVPFVRLGTLVFLSGQGPLLANGSFITGKVGKDLSIEDGYQAARIVCLQMLAAMRRAAGTLDNIVRIVKVLGMVNATTDFAEHPRVLNGCSDLLVEIFGDRGRHARSAVGMGSLPGNMAVEIEAVVEVTAD